MEGKIYAKILPDEHLGEMGEWFVNQKSEKVSFIRIGKMFIRQKFILMYDFFYSAKMVISAPEAKSCPFCSLNAVKRM